MATHIAMLRGVNVGGNPLSMARLRELWTELGFENVRTYVQSGNVVFDASGPAKTWQAQALASLAGETRLPVPIVFRTAVELAQVAGANPFLTEAAVPLGELHVTFLPEKAKVDAAKKLAALDGGADRLQLVGREIYLHCPNGYGRTKLSNNRLEKIVGAPCTTRNWNTVLKLCAMAAE